MVDNQKVGICLMLIIIGGGSETKVNDNDSRNDIPRLEKKIIVIFKLILSENFVEEFTEAIFSLEI